MTFNKKILAAAIVGGLFATAAQAQVVLDADPSTPVTYASELRIPAGPGGLLLTNGGDLDLEVSLGFSLSAGQVVYARVECPTNIRFAGNTQVAAAPTGTVGAINGLPGNVITFSITAAAGNPSPTNAATVLTINGDRTITSTANGACSYSLYDTPSQAQAGGTTGRIYTVSDSYINFARSYSMVVSPIGATANVEASPSFSRFTSTGSTGSSARGALGQVFFNTTAVNTLALTGQTVPQPLLANGAASTLAALLDNTSSHTITGDFSAAANADGSFDGDALNRVYFSNVSTCANITVPADEVTASGATFNIGPTAVPGLFLCYAPRSGLLIPESTYTQTFNAVSADSTLYTVSNIGPLNHGSIVRNGTSLQAQFVQVPAGWTSRIVLTNTGSVARPYTITAQTETGVTATLGAAATGSIPARTTLVLNTADIATFTGATRGTFNISIAAPNTQVQGLYQIVNGATGSIANTALVRPGTN